MLSRSRILIIAAMATVVTGASWAPAAPRLSPPVCRLHRRASPVIAAVPTAAAGPRLLYCDGLSKSYDGKRYQFRDISLGVAAGQRAGLVGVNGVGKSTLLRCLAGLEEADAGSVGVEGRPVVLYVEQEPARGQDSAGGATWTVADALTEPMVAGASASADTYYRAQPPAHLPIRSIVLERRQEFAPDSALSSSLSGRSMTWRGLLSPNANFPKHSTAISRNSSTVFVA